MIKFTRKKNINSVFLITGLLLIISVLMGCGSCSWNLDAVDYTPVAGEDWEVSTPEEQGLDPDLFKKVYYSASKLETIYSLLVVKNGYLIAEGYFNEGSIDQLSKRASVTKSYTGALVGIAIDKGYLEGVDQKMIDFFPDVAGGISDSRKKEITIREMLQMRAGYPWEETDSALWEGLWSGEYLSLIEGFPLTADPGTTFQYSNLTSHWLGIIVARAWGSDLKTFGEEYLFSPLDVTLGGWIQDVDGYYIGCGDIEFTARDMARFGLLYLNKGEYRGKQIISSEWVNDSLKTYTEDAWTIRVGRNFKDIGYGYQWWSARSGDHQYNLAWGHGGQLIIVIDDLDMVIVVTADPFYGPDDHWQAWKHEKANINLAADFIKSLPQ